MAVENQEIDYLDTKTLLLDLINNKEINTRKNIKRKIIFWYDANQEYISVIEKIKKEISNNNVELVIFDNNSFWIRYHIQIENPNKNFVIYLPHERKEDMQNELLDLEMSSGYEQIFNPDATTKIIVELGLKDVNAPIIKENKKFFANQLRRKKFMGFDAIKDNSTINYIITSILLGIKSINEDEIIKNVVKVYLQDKNKFEKIESFGNEKFILNLFNKNFGTELKSYSQLDSLLSKLVITYFVSEIDNKEKLDKYGDCLVPKRTNAQIFINSFMNDKTTAKIYEKLSEKVFKEFGLEELLNVNEILLYKKSDAFSIIDYNIIKYIVNQLSNNIFKYNNIKKIISYRQSKFWYEEFENEYNLILNVIEYLKNEKIGISKIETSSIEDLVKLYTTELYKIDTNYRKILFYYDKIKEKDDFKDLLELIEKHYTNNFMFELSVKWDEALEKLTNYSSNSLIMQNKFFEKYIKPEIIGNKNSRVIVIISDGFRYELAEELNLKLSKIAKTTELKDMLGVVPSYTQLAKAALLPHKTISKLEGDNVLADGKRASSTMEREKILESSISGSLAIQYNDLVNKYKKAEWKKLFSRKKVIYIYHNVVDKVGESDDDNVFEASERAIKQLFELVESLHKTFSGVNVFITADHGFFYKKGEIEPINKIKKFQSESKQKSRYVYSNVKTDNKDVIEIKLDYIFDNYNGYVEIPTGHNIFAKRGVPGKYFHGGILPQELIIPLIDFKSARGNKVVNKVGLVYSGLLNRITNVETYLNFTQSNSIDENNVACEYCAYFEDENKNKISNEVKIVANKTEKDYNDRIFKEKFVFKTLDYSINKAYYLVIREKGQNIDNSRLKFEIDIT